MRHSMNHCCLLFVSLVLTSVAAARAADELRSADESSLADVPMLDELPANERDAEIENWIAKLDSPRFSERQEARRRLSAAGVEALPKLIQSAANPQSREVSATVLDLLEELYRSPMPDTRADAEEALKQISADESNQLADEAERILKGPDESEYIPRPSFGQRQALRRLQAARAGRIQVGGQIQLGGRIQLGGGGGIQIMRMNVQNANGIRTIDVQENGKKITIKDDPKNGIELSVTEKVGGQDKTEKYAAKNLEELKKQHPEAEKLYQKYAKNGGLQAIVPQVPAQNAPAENATEKK
jgi:hypothetical protein